MWHRGFAIILISLASTGCACTERCADALTSFAHCDWFKKTSCPPLACCPDDYAHKPLPPLCPVNRCGGPDDYCLKPLPCITPIAGCGTCDDYCPKVLPCLLCPPDSPHLRCGSEHHATRCGVSPAQCSFVVRFADSPPAPQ